MEHWDAWLAEDVLREPDITESLIFLVKQNSIKIRRKFFIIHRKGGKASQKAESEESGCQEKEEAKEDGKGHTHFGGW